MKINKINILLYMMTLQRSENSSTSLLAVDGQATESPTVFLVSVGEKDF